jgi:hypothetical protein
MLAVLAAMSNEGGDLLEKFLLLPSNMRRPWHNSMNFLEE